MLRYFYISRFFWQSLGILFLFSNFLCVLWVNTKASSPVLRKAPLLSRTDWCLSWNQGTFSLVFFSSDFRKITQFLVLYMKGTQIHYLSNNLYIPRLIVAMPTAYCAHIIHMTFVHISFWTVCISLKSAVTSFV